VKVLVTYKIMKERISSL